MTTELAHKPLEELQALRAEVEAAIAAKANEPDYEAWMPALAELYHVAHGVNLLMPKAPSRADKEVINGLIAAFALAPLAPAEPVDEAVMETHINAAISDIFIGSIRNQSKPNDEWLRDILARLINNATLARDSRWPAGNWLEGEAVDIANETGQPYTAALEMARRLRAYQTGAAS